MNRTKPYQSPPSKKVLAHLITKYNCTEIAEKYRVHRSTVWNWCQKLGIDATNRGERQLKAKLTEHDVKLIRELYEEHGLYQKTIAEKFEVTPCTISEIVNYKSWIHVI